MLYNEHITLIAFEPVRLWMGDRQMVTVRKSMYCCSGTPHEVYLSGTCHNLIPTSSVVSLKEKNRGNKSGLWKNEIKLI